MSTLHAAVFIDKQAVLFRHRCLAMQVTMHVCVFVFDLLYVDGDVLVHLPLRQRRARLAQALPNLEPGFVQFATSMEFQPAALAAAAEGAAPDAATPAEAAAAVTAAAAGVRPHAQKPTQDPHSSSQASEVKQDHMSQPLPPYSNSGSTHGVDSNIQQVSTTPMPQSAANQHEPLQNSELGHNLFTSQGLHAESCQKPDSAVPGTTDAVACMPGDAGLCVDAAAAAAAEASPDIEQNEGHAVVSVSEVAVQSIEERIQVSISFLSMPSSVCHHSKCISCDDKSL